MEPKVVVYRYFKSGEMGSEQKSRFAFYLRDIEMIEEAMDPKKLKSGPKCFIAFYSGRLELVGIEFEELLSLWVDQEMSKENVTDYCT